MPIIDGALGVSVFEIVRDRIAAILSDELGNQGVLHAAQAIPEADLVDQLQRLKVITERYRPFNKNDYPAIDIFLGEDSFDNKDQSGVRGTAQFYIDVYTDGVRKETDPNTDAGDQLSSKRGQRLCGLIRSILDHSGYVSLLFNPPTEVYIQSSVVSSIRRTQEEHNRDGLNVMFYRVIFTVVMGECNGYLDNSVPIALHTTTVKVNETDLGYQYIFDPNA